MVLWVHPFGCHAHNHNSECRQFRATPESDKKNREIFIPSCSCSGRDARSQTILIKIQLKLMCSIFHFPSIFARLMYSYHAKHSFGQCDKCYGVLLCQNVLSAINFNFFFSRFERLKKFFSASRRKVVQSTTDIVVKT